MTERGSDAVDSTGLDGLDGTGVKVAVVDSGIRLDHPRVPLPAGGVAIGVPPQASGPGSEEYADPVGHGTACAGIIHRMAPGAQLYAVRVLAEDLTATEDALAAAVEWAVAHGMDVVNLSLGTTQIQAERLVAACARAARAGLILVAAHHRTGHRSLPAACPEVISVAAGTGLGDREYVWTGQADPEVLARGDQQRLCWVHPDYVLLDGPSFAAPRITGLVALIRQRLPGAPVKHVRGQLARHGAAPGRQRVTVSKGGAPEASREPMRQSLPDGRSPGGGPPSDRRPDSSPGMIMGTDRCFAWLGGAALYPYNKEMHALVRARHLLTFSIAAVADPVGKGLVGRDAGTVLGLQPAGLPIESSLRGALEHADSLILGYVDRLSRAARRDVLEESVAAAVERGKHVFSLLPVPSKQYPAIHARAARTGSRIVWPDLSAADVIRVLQDPQAEEPVEAPVLGVFGTSSRQGKFTLQLVLRSRLLAQGYRVAQIGTEHHAALFGMDLAFPMGYASPLRLPLQVYVPYLRGRLAQICARRKPDIVLIGGQSGTISYDVANPETHTLPTLAFLLGTQPDACVLVVNASDADGYIQDTMDALRALARSPVVLLAMGDRDQTVRQRLGRTVLSSPTLDGPTIRAHLRRLEQRFRIPAICITDPEDQERMMRVLTRYFSQPPLEEKRA